MCRSFIIFYYEIAEIKASIQVEEYVSFVSVTMFDFLGFCIKIAILWYLVSMLLKILRRYLHPEEPTFNLVWMPRNPPNIFYFCNCMSNYSVVILERRSYWR